MHLEVTLTTAALSHACAAYRDFHLHAPPALQRASLSIPDTLFLFVVALVVFGPKRLPEIGRQIGKLVFEFRRASNDFKLQIEEELRLSEQQERQKVIEAQATTAETSQPAASEPAPLPAGLTVQPPSTGETVTSRRPNQSAEATTQPGDPLTGSLDAVGGEKTEEESERAPIQTHPIQAHHG